MKIKFKLIDYDTFKMTMCENKSKFLINLINLINKKEKELKENQFYVVACDSDENGKVIVRIIKKRGE